MYQRMKEPISGLDFVKRIMNGQASATGGESPYATTPEFYKLVTDSPNGIEMTLHPDSQFSVSYGVYRDDTDISRPSVELGNFSVKLQAGNVTSVFSVDFGTLVAFATNGGKATLKAVFVPGKPNQDAPVYKRGALAGERLINLTPVNNRVLDVQKDGAAVLSFLEKQPAFKANTAPVPAGG